MHWCTTRRAHGQMVVLLTAVAVSVAGLPVVTLAPTAAAATVAAKPVEDVAERPDPVSAMVTARATGHRVEDLSQRSETTLLFANPDGTWTSESAPGPVRVQDAEGTWSDIDLTLAPVEGGIAPKAAIGDLQLSDGGDKTFASMEVDGRDLSWKWPTVLPEPVLDGNVATYPNAVEGGDLVLTATNAGFRHDIVLREAPTGPVSFSTPVATDGTVLTEDRDGTLSIAKKGGEVLVDAPAPVMYDASEDSVGHPDNTALVDTVVSKTAAGATVTLSPDEGFLNNPQTQYPVTIDPTYTSTSYASADTWVSTSNTSAVHPWDEDLVVGYNGTYKYRSFLKFANGVWDNAAVSSASLTMRNFDALTCSGSSVQVSRVTEDWANGSTNWTNKPGATTSGAGSSSVAKGYSSSCPSDDVSFPVTAIVQSWATNASTNYGFQVAAVNETATSSFRLYRSTDYYTAAGNGGLRPRLIVNYNRYPNTPTALTVDAVVNGYVPSVTPTLSAKVTDPDAGSVKVRFNVSQGATLVWSGDGSTVASGGVSVATIPAGKLVDAQTYTVAAYGNDGSVLSGKNATSGGFVSSTFTVDATTPVVPQLSCTGVADGQWYETRPAAKTTCTVAGNGKDVELWVNGQSKAALTTSGSASVDVPSVGYTLIQARSRTNAGVVSAWARVGFGTGSAALIYPIADDRSSSTFPIEAAAPPGATTAKLQWRFAPDAAAGAPDPLAGWVDAGGVKKDDGTATAWTGTVSGTETSATPKLMWDPHGEPGISTTALLEVRVLFTYSGGTKASPLKRVQVIPHAFGGSFPTSSAGPGQVGLFTGEFQMTQTDLAVPGYGGSLSLGRSHLSMAGTPAGPARVFGPGWTTDLSGPDEGLGGFTVTDRTAEDGSITLSSPEGDSYVYRHSSGTRGAQQPGDYVGVGETALDEDTLTMTTVTEDPDPITGKPRISNRLTLSEWDGTKTIFVRTNGAWTTEKVVGAEDSSTTRYDHDGEGAVTWIFAPSPAGVTCNADSQQPGCRALHLNYTGTGAAKRLASVDLRIYDPRPGTDGLPGAGAGMATIPVANYAYNSSGQLDATWDPRLGDGAAALKTTYTYSQVNGHTVLSSLTEPGLKTWNFSYDGVGKLISITRAQDAAVGGAVATWTVRYDLALSGDGLPDLTPAATASWGQGAADAPVEAAAVFGPDRVPGASPSADDYEYASLSYWTKSGRITNAASFGAGAWQIGSTRYDELGNTTWSLDAAGRNRALSEGSTAAQTAGAGEKYAALTVYNATGTRVEESYSPTHQFLLENGTMFTGRTLTQTVYDDEPDAEGFTDGRPTTGVPEGGFDLAVRQFTSATNATGSFDGPANTGAGTPRPGREFDTEETRYYYNPTETGDGDGWLLRTPTRVSTKDGGGWSTTSTRFDTEGKVIETRTPQANATTGSASLARRMQSVYYTADAAASRTECRNKVQWTGEVCWHGAAGAPGSGAAIPQTSATGYTALLAPTRSEETSGAAKRTSITGYDAAGRPVTSSVTTSGLTPADRTVPATTTTYSPTTGLPTSLTNGAQTQTTGYDTWGRVKTQTDGTGNTATTTYDAAGRVATVNDGKGTYTYTYNGTDSQGKKERRGLVTKLGVGLVTGPSEFTGAYDDTGALVEQNYPGDLQATWTHDVTGAPTGLTYTQGTTELLAFSNTLDRDGRVRKANGPASAQSYRYDDRDRLTNVEDTTTTGCTTREYGFSKDSNRTSLKTYAPASGTGTCQSTAAASTITPTFDDADRITTTGYTYDALGRTKTLPAADTTTTLSNPGDLAIGFHANDMVATLSQSGLENGTSVTKAQDFTLDTTGRISVIKTLTNTVSLDESTNHYAGGSDNPAWTDTKTRPNAATAWTNTWTRNITSMAGDLALTQSSDGTTKIQLANLHGDIVADAPAGSATINSYTETTEYGIPRTANSGPARYAWLGAKQRQSSGIVAGLTLMGARLHNSVTGRFLTRDSIEGGNDNTYVYPADPINRVDLDGRASATYWWGGWKSYSRRGPDLIRVWFNARFMYSLARIAQGTERIAKATALVSGALALAASAGVITSPGAVAASVMAVFMGLVGAMSGTIAETLRYLAGRGRCLGVKVYTIKKAAVGYVPYLSTYACGVGG